MNTTQAKRLGVYLRKARESRALSFRELARLSGIDLAVIYRLEAGEFQSPRPEKLATLAKVLGLEQDRVFELAGYRELRQLPSPKVYLRAKYRSLPSDRLAALTKELEAVFRRHGVDPEDQALPKPRARPATKDKAKKGGRK